MKRNIFVLLSIVLNVIIGLILLPNLPEQFIIHWNFSGNVDSSVNKYLGISIFPIIMFITWIIHAIFIKQKIKEELNYFILNILMVIYTIVNLFLLMENLGVLNTKVNLLGVLVGIIIIIIGNPMQKVKMNALYGVRTSWSMKNEETWMLTNRLGAKLLVAYGFLVILIAIFLPKYFLPIIMSILLILSIVIIYASYYFYKESLKKTN